MELVKKEGFSIAKRRAIQAAKELIYGTETIKLLRAAKTEDQLSDILMEARKHKNWGE